MKKKPRCYATQCCSAWCLGADFWNRGRCCFVWGDQFLSCAFSWGLGCDGFCVNWSKSKRRWIWYSSFITTNAHWCFSVGELIEFFSTIFEQFLCIYIFFLRVSYIETCCPFKVYLVLWSSITDWSKLLNVPYKHAFS